MHSCRSGDLLPSRRATWERGRPACAFGGNVTSLQAREGGRLSATAAAAPGCVADNCPPFGPLESPNSHGSGGGAAAICTLAIFTDPPGITTDTEVTEAGGAGKYAHRGSGESPMYWLVWTVTGAPPV